MSSLSFRLADFLEKCAYDLKEKALEKEQEKFFTQYGFEDRPQTERAVTKYNYYGGVSVLMLEELIRSGRISPEDRILDVGCGTGIFLIYLASQGFRYLTGQDLDPDLCAVARRNQQSFLDRCRDYRGHLEIRCENAVTTPFPDEITVCYLFNSFYDQRTYEDWLANVHASLLRAPRRLKILLLYPTPSSLSAFRQCGWLKETGVIRSNTQICSYCVRFQIFEALGVR